MGDAPPLPWERGVEGIGRREMRCDGHDAWWGEGGGGRRGEGKGEDGSLTPTAYRIAPSPRTAPQPLIAGTALAAQQVGRATHVATAGGGGGQRGAARAKRGPPHNGRAPAADAAAHSGGGAA